MTETGISRRSFLKATAAACAVAAASSGGLGDFAPVRSAFAEEVDEEREIHTACRACIHNCGVIAYVRNGRVVRLEGDPADPMGGGTMCAKGQSGIQALYNPMRNKYPMKHVGGRGTNEWARMSWDEATDEVADILMEQYKKYGGTCLITSSGGGGNPHPFVPPRFAMTFGSQINFEPGCAQCYLPRTMAYNRTIGCAINCDTSIADSQCHELYFDDAPTQCWVMWGTGPSQNSPAGGGRVASNLRARGVKTVVIDPRFTPDAQKSDVWLPIRPGTDVALMLAWMREIIDKKLYDEEFCTKWSDLPFLVYSDDVTKGVYDEDPDRNKAIADIVGTASIPQPGKRLLRESDCIEGGSYDVFMVWDPEAKKAVAVPTMFSSEEEEASFNPPLFTGDVEVTLKDGSKMVTRTAFDAYKERVEPWTLEVAAQVCWLNADDIAEAIQIYAQGPGGISLGVATDQYENSGQAALGACALDIMMGYVCKPGALVQEFTGVEAVGAAKKGFDSGTSDALPDMGPLFPPFVTYDKVVHDRLGIVEHKSFLDWTAGYFTHIPSIRAAIETGDPFPITVWMERSGNKMHNLGQVDLWYNLVGNLELVCHAYMYPTSFSVEFADYLFPLHEWLESYQCVRNINVLLARQGATQVFETQEEMMYWAKIAAKLRDRGHDLMTKAFDPEFTAGGLFKWPESSEEYYNRYITNPEKWADWNAYAEACPTELCSLDDYRTYYGYKRIDAETGLMEGFGTLTKRCEAYSEGYLHLGRTGQPLAASISIMEDLPASTYDYDPMPWYVEPCESPLLDTEYPFAITNGRVPYYHHGTLRNIPYLREIYPVPELWINPADAEPLGIAQGDWAKVSSRRGSMVAQARVTEGIPTGVLYTERFWNPEKLGVDGGWRDMNYNRLSNASSEYNNVENGTYNLRAITVKVEKADGIPEGIWYEPEDFEPWMPDASSFEVNESWEV